MRTARVGAQAKVNLTLVVGPKEDTGYHRIFTIFQRLELSDEVVVRVDVAGRSLDCGGPRLPSGGLGPAEGNLAYRAAQTYAGRAGWPSGYAIELTKHIPTGGGLGGGSADAGAVLRALDALAPSPLGPDALADLAFTLGADVPFLTSTLVLAGATGRGERLYPEDPLPARTVALVTPRFAVNTADAYRWIDEARSSGPPAGAEAWAEGDEMDADSWDSIVSGSMNSFEPVVERRHPEIAEYRRRLEAAGALLARMSGSGSTVFGVYEGAAPDSTTLGVDVPVIHTGTSERVVQVEVLE